MKELDRLIREQKADDSHVQWPESNRVFLMGTYEEHLTYDGFIGLPYGTFDQECAIHGMYATDFCQECDRERHALRYKTSRRTRESKAERQRRWRQKMKEATEHGVR